MRGEGAPQAALSSWQQRTVAVQQGRLARDAVPWSWSAKTQEKSLFSHQSWV